MLTEQCHRRIHLRGSGILHFLHALTPVLKVTKLGCIPCCRISSENCKVLACSDHCCVGDHTGLESLLLHLLEGCKALSGISHFPHALITTL